jgi:maltodextrin utilization protein YvdJ
MEEKTDWFQENKKTVYLIGVVVVGVFFLVLMFKFWMYTLTAFLAFAGGYLFAKQNEKKK